MKVTGTNTYEQVAKETTKEYSIFSSEIQET